MSNRFIQDGKPTPEGLALLSELVTDPMGQVYAFTDAAPPLLVAAAGARLSRAPGDMRGVFLEEFADAPEAASDLIERVVTQFGDDSVQQLLPMRFTTERVSNIATVIIEDLREASYLEQSTRYIYYDERDENGHFRYFVPPNLPAELQTYYREVMDFVFESYSMMVRTLAEYVRKIRPQKEGEDKRAWMAATRAQACDAARLVLPTATQSTVHVVMSSQSVEALVYHLASQELVECHDLAKVILRECRKVAGRFLDRADKPERGLAQIAYRLETRDALRHFISENLQKRPREMSLEQNRVKLLDYYPKHELDLVPGMLFEEAPGYTLRELERLTSSWSRELRIEAFRTYMGNRLNRRHRPGRALEDLWYKWEIECDYGIYRDLHRHRKVNAMERQRPTIRHGYEQTPQLVMEAGLAEAYEQCFYRVEKLHKRLVESGYEAESVYATLFGHRVRWRWTVNGIATMHIHELRTGPAGHPGYRRLCQRMHEGVRDVHPLMASAMKFVNMGEDEDLARIAAELATSRKLEKLFGDST